MKMAHVVQRAKMGRLRKEEREKFAGAFAQTKNLIELAQGRLSPQDEEKGDAGQPQKGG